RRVAAGHARTCTHRLHLCLPSREYPSPRGRPRNPHRREYARARTTMKPRSLSDSERRDWLRLARSQNVGPVTFAALIERFHSAAAALDELPRLARRGGASNLRIPSKDEAERELDATARLGGRINACVQPD